MKHSALLPFALVLSWTLLTLGCSPRPAATPPAPAAAAAPSAPETGEGYRLERSAGGGIGLWLQAEQPVEGRTPVLMFDCSQVPGSPALQIDFTQAPASPPPNSRAAARLILGRDAPVTIELTWAGEGGWWVPMERLSNERLEQIFSGRRIEIVPPAGYAPAGPFVWNTERLGARRAEVERACGHQAD
jgi:hypothetical protein